MVYRPKILAFAGSLRKESTNKKILHIAVEGAKEAGADVTVVDLAQYPLPIYNQEIEDNEGLPENAIKLKKLMLEHDGLLIASPEYNSSISGALKNTIDWISRKADPKEPTLSAFDGKIAGLIATSPGGLGGLRGLVHLRSILENIRVMVIPEQKTIPNNTGVFDPDGGLIDEKQAKALQHVGAKLTQVLQKLSSGLNRE